MLRFYGFIWRDNKFQIKLPRLLAIVIKINWAIIKGNEDLYIDFVHILTPDGRKSKRAEEKNCRGCENN